MKEKRLLKVLSEIEEKYIEEAAPVGKKRRAAENRHLYGNNHLFRWGAAAACVCLVCVSAIAVSGLLDSQLPPEGGLTVIPIRSTEQTTEPNSEQTDSVKNAGEQEAFASVRSLLAKESHEITVETLVIGKVSIGQYTGIYEKVQSVESAVLSENKGRNIPGTEEWHYLSGHEDLQYLIRNNQEEYSLWKFSCFDSGEYPYRDVLALVYQIDSAEAIREIEVRPARMDNTPEGEAIQEKIGTHTITDREEIEVIYDILSSLTCYGSDHWEMIDYGSTDVPADAVLSSHQAVWLGRYLSVFTDYGNEVDGLKYTAVSDMFYEFSGIAYNRLTEEQAADVCEIIGIERERKEEQSSDGTETEEEQSGNEVETKEEQSSNGTEIKDEQSSNEAERNTDVSLDYVTELQNKVSNAMLNHELPFVISSAVYENPYRLHVVVTSDSEDDLQKLKNLDTAGGVMEIVYAPENTIHLQ